MRENRTSGSVAGAPGNRSPYAGEIEMPHKKNPNKVSKDYRQSEWFRRWRNGTMRSRFIEIKRNLTPSSDHPITHGLYDLRGINFRKEKLRGIYASNCSLDESDFTSAFLDQGRFNNSHLIGAYFQGAKLHSAEFTSSILINAKFDGADLRKANFTDAVLRGTSFGNANLSGAIIENADISDCNFKNVRGLREVVGIPKTSSGLAVFYSDVIDAEGSQFGYYMMEQKNGVNPDHKFDLAISFAGEDRGIAKNIADGVIKSGKRVFYDEYEKAELWGKDLYVHLTNVYRAYARFCLILASESYAKKNWTNHERRAAQSRAFEENQDYILPLLLDETPIPGMLPTTGYIRFNDSSVGEVVELIVKKINESENF